jgi:hypothetical protein
MSEVFKRTSRFKTLYAQAVEITLPQPSVFKKVLETS